MREITISTQARIIEGAASKIPSNGDATSLFEGIQGALDKLEPISNILSRVEAFFEQRGDTREAVLVLSLMWPTGEMLEVRVDSEYLMDTKLGEGVSLRYPGLDSGFVSDAIIRAVKHETDNRIRHHQEQVLKLEYIKGYLGGT